LVVYYYVPWKYVRGTVVQLDFISNSYCVKFCFNCGI